MGRVGVGWECLWGALTGKRGCFGEHLGGASVSAYWVWAGLSPSGYVARVEIILQSNKTASPLPLHTHTYTHSPGNLHRTRSLCIGLKSREKAME